MKKLLLSIATLALLSCNNEVEVDQTECLERIKKEEKEWMVLIRKYEGLGDYQTVSELYNDLNRQVAKIKEECGILD